MPESELTPARGRGSLAGAVPVLLVAAVGGAGTMAVELSAVRLLAPWFGTSLSVWTNVIGVILLALAIGYLVGARLSSTGRPLAKLAGVLALAALFTALLPAAARPVCEYFLPSGVALHEAADLVRYGSLAAALLLFLPAPVCLGMVGPLAVETVQRRTGAHAGTAGGQVLSTSTLGSLVGTFGTTHYLLPELGLRLSFLIAGATLAAAGGVAWWLARRASSGPGGSSGASAATLLGFVAVPLAALLPAPTPELPEGATLLAASESEYQHIRIVEQVLPGAPALRTLQVNEGFDSFQSVWVPEPGLLPEGYYYNDFVLPAWFSAAERVDDSGERTWRVLVLGLGGGTALRVIGGALPEHFELAGTGIELDPEVVRLARAHMDLGADAHVDLVAGLDARAGTRLAAQPFDQVVVDCYANQVEIPPHLSTVEFFEELGTHLRPGGWISINVGGFGIDDPVVRAVASSAAAGLDTSVLALRVPSARNVVLFARPGAALPYPGSATWLAVGEPVQSLLLSKRTLPGAWTLFEPDGEEAWLLTDERNAIEFLQRQSIAEARERMRRGRVDGAGGRP